MAQRKPVSRRALMGGVAADCSPLLRSTTAMAADAMLTRPIPSSGEAMPVIGLGTWQVFDTGEDEPARAPLKEVLQRLVPAGGGGVPHPPVLVPAPALNRELFRARGVDRRGLFPPHVR